MRPARRDGGTGDIGAIGTEAVVQAPADGYTLLLGTFVKFIADETEKWAKVVKFAGIKAD